MKCMRLAQQYPSYNGPLPVGIRGRVFSLASQPRSSEHAITRDVKPLKLVRHRRQKIIYADGNTVVLLESTLTCNPGGLS